MGLRGRLTGSDRVHRSGFALACRPRWDGAKATLLARGRDGLRTELGCPTGSRSRCTPAREGTLRQVSLGSTSSRPREARHSASHLRMSAIRPGLLAATTSPMSRERERSSPFGATAAICIPFISTTWPGPRGRRTESDSDSVGCRRQGARCVARMPASTSLTRTAATFTRSRATPTTSTDSGGLPTDAGILYGKENDRGIYVIGADGRNERRITTDSPPTIGWGSLRGRPTGGRSPTSRTGRATVTSMSLAADGHNKVRLTRGHPMSTQTQRGHPNDTNSASDWSLSGG